LGSASAAATTEVFHDALMLAVIEG
jgi:hypothetical protein